MRVVEAARPRTVARVRTDARVPRGETGNLRRSIHAGPITAGPPVPSFRLTAPVIQASTTDKGARPHPIRPRRAGGVLVFDWPKAGGVVFLRHVNHPGNPPRPWWRAVVTDAYRAAIRDAARATPFR